MLDGILARQLQWFAFAHAINRNYSSLELININPSATCERPDINSCAFCRNAIQPTKSISIESNL